MPRSQAGFSFRSAQSKLHGCPACRGLGYARIVGRFRRWLALGAFVVLCASPLCVRAQSRRAAATQRPLLTNTHVEDAVAPADIALPSVVAQQAAAEGDLRRMDAESERALAALQGGKVCGLIRDASRVTVRARLFGDHERELSVAAALVLAAGLITVFARLPHLRALLALPPLIGAIYLGRVAYARVDSHRTSVLAGLHACTAELPLAEPRDVGRVQLRWARSQELVAVIRRVAAEERGAGSN
jgi:hypothetical protein